MVNSTDFTKRLEQILEFYGLSATAFSEKIDFNRSTISHLLSGRNKPSLEFVMKVVQTFKEVDLYWLLNGKGSFPSQRDTVDKTSEEKKMDVYSGPLPEKSQNRENDTKIASPTSNKDSSRSIDRIVIFYTDGSFKEYLP